MLGALLTAPAVDGRWSLIGINRGLLENRPERTMNPGSGWRSFVTYGLPWGIWTSRMWWTRGHPNPAFGGSGDGSEPLADTPH